MKLWGGRFRGKTDELVERFNASLPFDRRLYREDIEGSVAHARMLGKQGILSEKDAESIIRGLYGILSDIDADDLRLWVSLHEQTHAVQFNSAPWLLGHVEELIASLSVDDPSPAEMTEGIRAGRGVASLLVTAEGQRHLDALTATMTLLEGHADLVADAAGAVHVPSVRRLRATFARPAAGTGWRRLIPGLDKGLQYRDGLAFCQHVGLRAGMGALTAAFAVPANLPTVAEIADPGHRLLVIRRKDGVERVGYALVHLDFKSERFELRRIVIAQKGRGYGRESMEALLKYAFETLKFNRFWLDVYPDNAVGIKLYESLGLHRDGVLRQNFKSERGYLDQIIYSMLKEEYFHST